MTILKITDSFKNQSFTELVKLIPLGVNRYIVPGIFVYIRKQTFKNGYVT